MATARKLPSGSWRCQVYSHTEEILQPDGTIKKKRVYKSFTCDDPSPKGKRKCEKEAAEWADAKELYPSTADMTLKQAIKEYCAVKCNVLSPATIRGYKQMAQNRYKDIEDFKLSQLSQDIVQRWINTLAAKYSQKYVRNIYGLFSAVLDMYAPALHFRTKLPQKVRPDLYVPSDADIKALVDFFRLTDKDMLLAVYLAAFGTLRRSEVCGVTVDDVIGNTVRVRKAIVLNEAKEWKQKTTKTYSSQRDVEMPSFFIDLLPESGKIVNLTPAQVTMRFKRALSKIGLPDFRFHDLRHYSASIMHAIGIPDQYIMGRGGWSSDGTLKRIYRNEMDEYGKKFTKQVLNHFESMQHDVSHGLEETK